MTTLTQAALPSIPGRTTPASSESVNNAVKDRLKDSNNLSDVDNATISRTNLGLGNVDNTSDASKPVSSAQAGADNLRCLKTSNLSDVSSTVTAKSNLGMGNVNNTTDANKPISNATQVALNAKANTSGVTFTGSASGITPTSAAHLTRKDYVDGLPRVLKISYLSTSSYISGTGNVPADGTIPQISEGRQVFTGSHNRVSATSTLYFEFIGNLTLGVSTYGNMSLFLGGASNAVATNFFFSSGLDRTYSISLGHSQASGGTGPLFVEIRAGIHAAAVNMYINGISSGNLYGGNEKCVLKVTEYE